MSDLSPELHKLVLADRRANWPTLTDFARVLSALQRRLCVTIVVDGNPAARGLTGNVTNASSSNLLGISLAGLALVIGGITWQSSRGPQVTTNAFYLSSIAEAVASAPLTRASTATTPKTHTRSLGHFPGREGDNRAALPRRTNQMEQAELRCPAAQPDCEETDQRSQPRSTATSLRRAILPNL